MPIIKLHSLDLATKLSQSCKISASVPLSSVYLGLSYRGIKAMICCYSVYRVPLVSQAGATWTHFGGRYCLKGSKVVDLWV